MNLKRFFSKQANIILFMTVLFAIVGLLFAFVVPSVLLEVNMANVRDELEDIAYNHETVTQVHGTTHLYVYKEGVSTMLTATGYIDNIHFNIESHLIHWSEVQVEDIRHYDDDFQNEMFIYFIYVVEDGY